VRRNKLSGEIFAMYLSDSGKVLSQSLCTRLTHMQLSTDSPYRRNAVSCQVRREHDGGMFVQRIGHAAILTRPRPSRRPLLTADHHHQQLIRPDERDRRPRADSGTDQAVTQTVGDVSGQRRDNLVRTVLFGPTLTA
jgi:hypothetical protein